MQQVKYLNINTEDRLQGAIELILEQAGSEELHAAQDIRVSLTGTESFSNSLGF